MKKGLNRIYNGDDSRFTKLFISLIAALDFPCSKHALRARRKHLFKCWSILRKCVSTSIQCAIDKDELLREPAKSDGGGTLKAASSIPSKIDEEYLNNEIAAYF